MFLLIKRSRRHGIDTPAPAYDPAPADGPHLPVGQALAGNVAELKELGWHVEPSDDGVNLCAFFKNGKPRKSASVQIGYAPMTVDFFDDLDGKGMQEHHRPSRRPYWVSSVRLGGARTFTHALRAVALFLEEARRLAPGARQ